MTNQYQDGFMPFPMEFEIGLPIPLATLLSDTLSLF